MEHGPWNMALNNGIWDPKPRVTNNKGTNLKSLIAVARSRLFRAERCLTVILLKLLTLYAIVQYLFTILFLS